MALNTNIRLKSTGPSGFLVGLGAATEGFSEFFQNVMEQKRSREKKLREIIEELRKNEPLKELNQQRANEDIQNLINEIADMKSKNRKLRFLRDWTDEDMIKINSKADQLKKKFAEATRMEKMFEEGEKVINKDMGKTIDREAFYNLMLKTWETGEYPKDEEGRPVPMFEPTPQNYEEAFVKLNASRIPRKKFLKYEKGQAIDVWTYDVTDAQRRDAAIGLTTNPGLKKGADWMLGRLPDVNERMQAATGEGVDPTEVYLAEKAEKELWQDRLVSRPLTAAEKEALKPKETAVKKRVVERQGNSWPIHDKPILLKGYKGEDIYVTALKFGQPPGTMKEGLYFEVYKKAKNITEENEISYIPYNEISSIVERTNEFKGLDEIKKGIKPFSYEKPKGVDMSKLTPNISEWDKYLRYAK